MKKKLKTSVVTIIAMIAITLCASGQSYNFIDTSFYSPILDETKSMRIYLPPGYNDDTTSYPVVYYLHGATQSYLALTQYMQQLQSMIDSGYIHPMLVVGLDGQCDPFAGSMYTNSLLYGNYEDYIIQEAIPFAESVLRTKNSPHYRCIMGFAMGAYGSMKLALKHTELFAGIASYNGFLQFDTTLVMWQAEVNSENPGPPYNYQYGAGFFTDLLFTGAGAFSPNLNILPYQVEFVYDTMGVLVDSVVEKWKEHDCSRLVKDIDTISYKHPGLFFACGIYDFLYPHPTNTCFADTLDDLGIDYEFLTTDDGHILSDEMLLAGMYFLDSVMYDSIWVGNIEYVSGKSSTLSIYPNPSFDYITIETSEIPARCHLFVMNISGQTLINRKITELKTVINISKLHSGVYFVRLTGDRTDRMRKIIKH
jgi:S-formylglutathione hydrolase FrmB